MTSSLAFLLPLFVFFSWLFFSIFSYELFRTKKEQKWWWCNINRPNFHTALVEHEAEAGLAFGLCLLAFQKVSTFQGMRCPSFSSDLFPPGSWEAVSS